MGKKAQTSLEYLLLIAGGIGIAAVAVFIAMNAFESTGETAVESSGVLQQCIKYCLTCADSTCTADCLSQGGPVTEVEGGYECGLLKGAINVTPEGGSCLISGECEPGLFCNDDGICQSFEGVKLNEDCSTNADCIAGLACEDIIDGVGSCQIRPPEDISLTGCSVDADCDVAALETCDVASGLCVTPDTDLGDIGTTCGVDGDCSGALFCYVLPNASTGTCQASIPEGDGVCDGINGETVANSSDCSGGGAGGGSGGTGGGGAGDVCGDSILGSTEQCDDGNLVDEDGCSSLCRFEDAITFGDYVDCDNSLDLPVDTDCEEEAPSEGVSNQAYGENCNVGTQCESGLCIEFDENLVCGCLLDSDCSSGTCDLGENLCSEDLSGDGDGDDGDEGNGVNNLAGEFEVCSVDEDCELGLTCLPSNFEGSFLCYPIGDFSSLPPEAGVEGSFCSDHDDCREGLWCELNSCEPIPDNVSELVGVGEFCPTYNCFPWLSCGPPPQEIGGTIGVCN